jgi:hypothetical protein
VGYRDWIIDGPLVEYIGALMAPCETTCNLIQMQRFIKKLHDNFPMDRNKFILERQRTRSCSQITAKEDL